MARRVPVRFERPDVTVWVMKGDTLLDAALEARVPMPFPCGARALCGKCAVRVLAGDPGEPDEAERSALRSAPAGVRLACRLRVRSPLTVRPVTLLHTGAAGGNAGILAAGTGTDAAVDLGTTTVSAQVFDRHNGAEAWRGEALNRQASLGADVATRITLASQGRADTLRKLALASISESLGEAASSTERIVVACNTVMAHLAIGERVEGLAAHPYTPAFEGAYSTTAGELGLGGPAASSQVWFVPAMSGFVGGDATAGALALALDDVEAPHVLVDLGTNAEIVVAANGILTATSAAAGPAFEGGHIACGGCAGMGAVERAGISGGEWALTVNGGGEPISLCGSGLLEALAALRASGHLDETGRLRTQGPLERLFHRRDDVLAVQMSGEAGGDGVYLTQLDVRELQLAKAAVAAALEAAVASSGSTWEDIEVVHVAGNLGRTLRADVLRELGVLPPDFGGRVVFEGNTALAGAAAIAMDDGERERAIRMAASARVVEPAMDAGFGRAFLAHTAFP